MLGYNEIPASPVADRWLFRDFDLSSVAETSCDRITLGIAGANEVSSLTPTGVYRFYYRNIRLVDSLGKVIKVSGVPMVWSHEDLRGIMSAILSSTNVTLYSITQSTGVLKSLGSVTVDTSPATVAHGLGYTPRVVIVTMTSAGNIYRQTASDNTNVYLQADASSRNSIYSCADSAEGLQSALRKAAIRPQKGLICPEPLPNSPEPRDGLL